jgi:hypothetical protein
VLAAAVFMAWRGSAVAADEGPYPIWWSPVLELDSLDNVEQRLDRRLWKDSDAGFELYRKLNGRRITANADNCRSLLKLSAEGFEAPGNNDHQIQLLLVAKCRVIELLGQAKPARRSFVRNFGLDADTRKSMPPPIDGPSCSYICRQIYANENGFSWSAFDSSGRVEVVDENTIKIVEEGWEREVQLVGRADVDNDGLEDLMLLVDSCAAQGTYGTTNFFLMTRATSGSVLRILEPGQYRCANYTCAPGYPMPELSPDDEIGRD